MMNNMRDFLLVTFQRGHHLLAISIEDHRLTIIPTSENDAGILRRDVQCEDTWIASTV